ncbi:MAG: hypothetical protein QOI57_189 [Rubrobacteraceae bacterium]|nr:hypothetical protein [Rubrobacteraceae bacterium]
MRLENVVPWGRSKAEYVGMFDLTPQDPFRRILDCAGGPASFNAEMSRQGHEVLSCDPIYRFSAEDIARRVEETYREIMSGVRANLKGFVWRKIESPERLGEIRMSAMRRFLEDFPRGFREGRYVAEELPVLPFGTDRFDLALCSHFLFTYSEQLSENFHLVSILEMCRVAEEVRIFPLLTSSVHRGGSIGEPYPHLKPVVNELEKQGYEAQVKRVPYEFQKGGNEMLRVRRLTTRGA